MKKELQPICDEIYLREEFRNYLKERGIEPNDEDQVMAMGILQFLDSRASVETQEDCEIKEFIQVVAHIIYRGRIAIALAEAYENNDHQAPPRTRS